MQVKRNSATSLINVAYRMSLAPYSNNHVKHLHQSKKVRHTRDTEELQKRGLLRAITICYLYWVTCEDKLN
jgi:hypothetical protein